VDSVQGAYKIDTCNSNACSTKHLWKRGVRSKCSAPEYSGSKRRSDISILGHFVTNNTLWRRAMELPGSEPGGIETFMMRETGPKGWAAPVIWPIGAKKDPTDVNTALFHDFTKKRSLTAIRLQGCTMLVIVGRKGIYMGHFWENIAFAPDDKHMEPGETPEDTFKRTVIDGLENGIPDDGPLQQESLTDFAKEIASKDDDIRAFLIRPDKSQKQEEIEELAIAEGKPINTDTSTLGYPELA
jgi:hypothetical protein